MEVKFCLFESREKLAEALAVYTADAARAGVRRLEPILLKIEDAMANRSLFAGR